MARNRAEGSRKSGSEGRKGIANRVQEQAIMEGKVRPGQGEVDSRGVKEEYGAHDRVGGC